MSFSALSLVALPAATGLARDVARAGERLGSGFLSVLSQIASPDSDDPDSAGDASKATSALVAQSPASDRQTPAPTSLSDKTKSWCQKFMSWLNERQMPADVDVQLSLDSLDQPRMTINGQQSQTIDEAMAQDPTWLQEFRELALDRVDEQGSALAKSPPTSSPTLRITQRDGNHQAAWSH